MTPLFKQLGFVNVDAGLLMVGDPCYHIGRESSADWRKWLNDNNILTDNFEVANLKSPHGSSGAGIVVPTDFGDGSFPVYRIANGTLVVCSDWDTAPVVGGLRQLADFLELAAQNEE